MSNFEERSGAVLCPAPWGGWHQSLEEVTIEIEVPPGTRAKQCQCSIQPRHLTVTVNGTTILDGELPSLIQPDESLWTLEDGRLLCVVLVKSDRTAANCWRGLLQGAWQADSVTWDKMQQKLTLQRFQIQNPGMDFSGADISGNYHGGGPDLP